VLSNLINAQNITQAFLSKVSTSMSKKYSFAVNKPYNNLEATDFYFGYVFKNHLTAGINFGISKYNDGTNFYNAYLMGIEFKYLSYKKNGSKLPLINFIPYFSANYGITSLNNTESDYYLYDIGFNLIYPKFPYLFIGLGLCQNFYLNGQANLLTGYFSLGIRY
jgi:hypothetical protein